MKLSPGINQLLSVCQRLGVAPKGPLFMYFSLFCTFSHVFSICDRKRCKSTEKYYFRQLMVCEAPGSGQNTQQESIKLAKKKLIKVD